MPLMSRSSIPARLCRLHAARVRAIAPAMAMGEVYPGIGGFVGKRADVKDFTGAGRETGRLRVWSVNQGS